jgi:hypothetical protein
MDFWGGGGIYGFKKILMDFLFDGLFSI